jgi:hypothetical protein
MAQTNGGKSLWMQNFAVRSQIWDTTLYITLEMVREKLWKDRRNASKDTYKWLWQSVEGYRYDKKQKIRNLSKAEGGDIFWKESW